MSTDVPLPDSFLEQVYTSEQVWTRIGWTEERFWLALANREIPAPVLLPMADGTAMLLWLRELIHAWQDAGCPMDPQAAEHQTLLLMLFASCFEQEFGRDAMQAVIDNANLTPRQQATLARSGYPVPGVSPTTN